jgi:hypothetical protein
MSRNGFPHNRWRHAGVAAAMGLAIVIGMGNGVRAEDEEYVAPDTKFFRSLLKGLGLRKDGESIEYRERSPLVLPPGKDLRPPEPEHQARKTSAWPNDPDVRRVRERKEQDKKWVRDPEDGERPALPSVYGRPNPPTRKDGGVSGKSAEESEAPSTAKELGSKNIFSNWFAPREEYSTFGSEPRRGALTEPPPGYRTPSPNQPYGVGKEKWKPATPDRAAAETR